MSFLTNRVKQYAFELGADLVGVANIERYEHAPIMMSPQGILPEARSVVVMALHHPDGCIEMGGEPHPQVVGPYAVQYTMNQMLDEISFKMGRFLQDLGFRSVPIVSSNIWRYRGYEGLRENFAPDVSHMHAAVAAGLADFGFSGLALTPEYGARIRFVQIITTAELSPSPLLEPGSLCDDCGLCKKHCPSAALVKEIDGWNEVPIEDKVYRYANKNLWRCAWGEHFDLDLDLEIPEQVTEELILAMVEEHGMRAGEFGCCLRFCLPKAIRSFDKAYTRAPRRNNRAIPPSPQPDRKVLEQIPALSAVYGCQGVQFFSSEDLKSLGIDPSSFLPDAVSLAVPYVRTAETHTRLRAAARQKCEFSAYRIARLLEDAGHSVVCHSPLEGKTRKILCSAVDASYIQTIFTSAALPSVSQKTDSPYTMPDINLKKAVVALAQDRGIDLIGISSAARLDRMADKLASAYSGRSILTAADNNNRFKPFDPEITEEPVQVRHPDEILDQAQSIIVLGQAYPAVSAERAGQPPALTVGPYVFARYEAQFLLTRSALDICAQLQALGHQAVVSFDPLGLGGMVGSVRGELYDHFSCRFAAAAAGAAVISRAGYAVSEEFGPHQVFLAILTDAELGEDPVSEFNPCTDCDTCISACTDCAFTDTISIDLDGRSFTYQDRDLNRCDWNKRYALTADSGFGVMGSDLDIPAPDKVTPANLGDALKQHDPVTKYRPSVAEKCVLACPLGKVKGSRT